MLHLLLDIQLVQSQYLIAIWVYPRTSELWLNLVRWNQVQDIGLPLAFVRTIYFNHAPDMFFHQWSESREDGKETHRCCKIKILNIFINSQIILNLLFIAINL